MDARHFIGAAILLIVGYVIAKKTAWSLPLIG